MWEKVVGVYFKENAKWYAKSGLQKLLAYSQSRGWKFQIPNTCHSW